MKPSFDEGTDYYFDSSGLMVLTERYLLERGFCCGNGCRNCPFDYQAVPEPRKSALKKNRTDEKKPGQNREAEGA